MKPLSEFAEGLREQKAHTYSSENADHYRGFDAGLAHAAVLLQAWLREAIEWLETYPGYEDHIHPPEIKRKLLGTTRMEGKK